MDMIDRRKFLQNAIGSALALASVRVSDTAFAQTNSNPATATTPASGSTDNSLILRGVNLGGWLVLEKWMVPDVYRETDASDEYGLCLALGGQARSRLDEHRETFITEDDFRWIRNCGLNAVRLPVGYWALEAPKPFVPAADFVDFALEQAQRNGLKLILDLHGAPGSQNGWDHSGRGGEIGWHKDPNNIKETIRILGAFAQKYGKHPALYGIEMLNEPSPQIPIAILKEFYENAYSEIRRHTGMEVAVVFHDSFRAMAWQDFMKQPQYSNVIIDTHLYQSFGHDDAERNAQEQLIFALKRKSTLEQMQREELPTLVGEWSLALPYPSTRDLSSFQEGLVTSAYADAQLLCFENTRGWFFWSYKMKQEGAWNFRYCVEHGWLPERFPSAVS
jgi:glucan 1,3-beta-glucosidase